MPPKRRRGHPPRGRAGQYPADRGGRRHGLLGREGPPVLGHRLRQAQRARADRRPPTSPIGRSPTPSWHPGMATPKPSSACRATSTGCRRVPPSRTRPAVGRSRCRPDPPSTGPCSPRPGRGRLGLHPFPFPMAINSVDHDGRPGLQRLRPVQRLRLSHPGPRRRPRPAAAGAAHRAGRTAHRNLHSPGRHGAAPAPPASPTSTPRAAPGFEPADLIVLAASAVETTSAGTALGVPGPARAARPSPHVPLVHRRVRRLPRPPCPCQPRPLDFPRCRGLRRPGISGRPVRRRGRRAALLPWRSPGTGRHPGSDRRGARLQTAAPRYSRRVNRSGRRSSS